MATKVINSLTFGDTYVFTTPYATSSTGATTQAKVATLTPNSNFSLETGVRVAVKFSAANTASSPTLNVNSSGAKTIQFRGAALTSSLYRWAANSVVEFMYDGTYWQMLGAPDNTNNTYSVNNATITLSAGTGLSGGGDFTTNQSSAETITFSLGDSGVTAGTYGPSANVTGNNNATMSVPEITVDRYGRITSIVNRTYTAKNTDTDTNTHYTTKLFATSSTGTAHAATTNGNTYLRLFDDSTARQSIKITGSGATSVTSDANGVITISSTDTNTHPAVSNNAPTLAWGTTSTVGTVGGTALTVTMPSNPNTDTYGRSGNTASKIYLMGTLEQSTSNKTSYSNVSCYASGGYLYSGGTKVSVEGHTHTFTDTNTAHAHTAGDGISLSGSGGTTGTTTISLAASGVTSGSYGPSSNASPTHSGTFSVPYITVDTYGRITAASTKTITLPSDNNTTYSYPNLMGCSCTTSASTTAKTATLSGFSSTYLKAGATVFVRFTYAHTGTRAATLNISSSGAKTIYRNGKTITSGNANSWSQYEVVKMVYDGAYWQYYDTELTWASF